MIGEQPAHDAIGGGPHRHTYSARKETSVVFRRPPRSGNCRLNAAITRAPSNALGASSVVLGEHIEPLNLRQAQVLDCLYLACYMNGIVCIKRFILKHPDNPTTVGQLFRLADWPLEQSVTPSKALDELRAEVVVPVNQPRNLTLIHTRD